MTDGSKEEEMTPEIEARIVALIPYPNVEYTGWPSCTTCHVDYLGQGECGPCLFTRRIVADRTQLGRALAAVVDD